MPAEGGSAEFLGKEYEPIAPWSRDARCIYAIGNADGKRQLGKLEWRGGAFHAAEPVGASLEKVTRAALRI